MKTLFKIINALLSLFSSKKAEKKEEDACINCGTPVVSKPTNSSSSGKQFPSWCFHSPEKNETQEAIRRALKDNGNGLILLFVCKPGCAVCKAAWDKANTLALDNYLNGSKIVGLRIDDSAGHFIALNTLIQSWKNSDGPKPSGGNPFLALVQVKESSLGKTTSFSLSQKDGDVEKLLSGSNAFFLPVIDDLSVIDWLEATLKKEEPIE